MSEFEISFLKDNEIKGTTITASSEQNAVIKFRRDYGDFDIVEIEEKQKIIIKTPLTCGVFIYPHTSHHTTHPPLGCNTRLTMSLFFYAQLSWQPARRVVFAPAQND